mmetsp:Transcript_7137/g.14458  ORF Transcript_7137/g.14458 Transcript_7137/m.14458 type:complete len:458 (-) Transcript_7137:2630-4003(-)
MGGTKWGKLACSRTVSVYAKTVLICGCYSSMLASAYPVSMHDTKSEKRDLTTRDQSKQVGQQAVTVKPPVDRLVSRFFANVSVVSPAGTITSLTEMQKYSNGRTAARGKYASVGIPVQELGERIPGLLQEGPEVDMVQISSKDYCTFDYSTITRIPVNPYVVGILPTKDDGSIVCEWLHHNAHHFDVLLVVDGSDDPLTEVFFSSVPNTIYLHERSHQEMFTGKIDSEMRRLGHELAQEHFGNSGYWIHIAHTDEFLYHSPRTVFRAADEAKADAIRWLALHVIPHTTEYDSYLANPVQPVHRMFRHYYFYSNRPGGAFRESRSFKNTPYQNYSLRWCEVVPDSVKRYWDGTPAYIHYKLWNLTLDAYTADGVHKHHWNRVEEKEWKKIELQAAEKAKLKGLSSSNFRRGVGMRMALKTIRDFFVDKWPVCCKYTTNSVFNGFIASTLNVGEHLRVL